jgi:hypothetical protein
VTTATNDARWVTILDGFVAVHGTDIAWVCRRIIMSHGSMSRIRAGKPGYPRVTAKNQQAIAALFQVPVKIIFGPWDHWPWDATMARLWAIVEERGMDIPAFKRRIVRDNPTITHDHLVGPVEDWSPEVRAGVSRLLWVPVSAIWHDGEEVTL